MSPNMPATAADPVDEVRGLPGTAIMGARMYGLRDKTMGPPPSRAQKAREDIVLNIKPDRLETRAPKYNLSTYVEQNKFTLRHQEQKLCNSVDPATFKSRTKALDHNLFDNSTIKHPPAHLGGHAVLSITFTKDEFAGPWNASTTQSYKDFAAAQQTFSEKAKAATMKKTTKLLQNYSTPKDRETAKMEEMRRKKREQIEYVQALESTYGREGALTMMKAEEENKNRNRHRGRFSKHDKEAIAELDTFDPTKPRRRKGEEPELPAVTEDGDDQDDD